MEDEKLTAYYDELTRKGGGAARYKQGLGFCSSKDAVPERGSAIPSPSLSSFVRASSPSKADQFDKAAQLRSIQNKLNQKPQLKTLTSSRSSKQNRSPVRESSRSRSRSRDRCSKRNRSQSPSRDKYSRRRERSCERHSKDNCWSSSRSKENDVVRRLPEERRQQKGKRRKGCGTDFTKLIDGYDRLSPAERVKAKMKLQLSITTENDETIGKGSGWERFDFNKDAPLDDEEIEAVEDDGVLMKHIGQSFRFSAVETRKEEQVKAAHDKAIYGASSFQPLTKSDESESYQKITSLINDQVVKSMQQVSWRDRIRKR